MKVMNKLKEKFKQWLFKEEIKKIRKLENDLEKQTSRYENSTTQLKVARDTYKEAQKTITEMINIGVDVSYNGDESWAVICIKGKPNYVKFIDLRGRNIREIEGFLKKFEYSNKTIDAPFLSGITRERWL